MDFSIIHRIDKKNLQKHATSCVYFCGLNGDFSLLFSKPTHFLKILLLLLTLASILVPVHVPGFIGTHIFADLHSSFDVMVVNSQSPEGTAHDLTILHPVTKHHNGKKMCTY